MAKQERPLRRGWTTGTCAAAAAKAAYTALIAGKFPDPVAVTLPRGERTSFALAMTRQGRAPRPLASSRMPVTIRTSPTARWCAHALAKVDVAPA